MRKQDRQIEFPCRSRFITVKGSKMHYIEEGKGDPILFLHGVPTSSFLWRNIIPFLSKFGHCIALDLIGFGQSDKPNIEYNTVNHIEYVQSFIQQLDLKNITFVMHGFGSLIGMNFASQFPEMTKAIAFYESHVHSETDWNKLSLPVQQYVYLLTYPERVKKAIVQDNYFMKKIFPACMLHKVDDEILKRYNEPFTYPEDRIPLYQYVLDLPFGKSGEGVTELINHYSLFLQKSSIPKLMLYTIPGFVTPIDTVVWCKNNLPNLEVVDLGEELHFAQETLPHSFGRALQNWYAKFNHY